MSRLTWQTHTLYGRTTAKVMEGMPARARPAIFVAVPAELSNKNVAFHWR